MLLLMTFTHLPTRFRLPWASLQFGWEKILLIAFTVAVIYGIARLLGRALAKKERLAAA